VIISNWVPNKTAGESTDGCVDETGKRIDAVASNKRRGSYGKAANLLEAMAEGLAQRGEMQEGMVLVEKYRSKYPRHRIFQSEIAEARKKFRQYR